jgi:putative spermidine/putrescine transport system permease protein
VVLPLSAPGTLAALALTFVIALGFYITPALLGGGRVVMIAEFITFYVQNVLAWGKASALAIFLIAAIGASYGLVKLPEMLLRRSRTA